MKDVIGSGEKPEKPSLESLYREKAREAINLGAYAGITPAHLEKQGLTAGQPYEDYALQVYGFNQRLEAEAKKDMFEALPAPVGNAEMYGVQNTQIFTPEEEEELRQEVLTHKDTLS
jgi:hypothetical protein